VRSLSMVHGARTRASIATSLGTHSRCRCHQHATSYEAIVHCPTQRSSKAILSSGEGAPSDVATHSSKEGVTGGKRRSKQRLQEVATMTGHDDGNDGEAGGFDVRHNSTTTCSDKCQTRPPTGYFKRFLEEAYPNHVYPVRHKLKDCSMMRSFTTLASLTWGAELDEGPDGSDTTPFPGENAVLMVYGGRSHWGGTAYLT
jgi:hypothetical protein